MPICASVLTLFGLWGGGGRGGEGGRKKCGQKVPALINVFDIEASATKLGNFS